MCRGAGTTKEPTPKRSKQAQRQITPRSCHIWSPGRKARIESCQRPPHVQPAWDMRRKASSVEATTSPEAQPSCCVFLTAKQLGAVAATSSARWQRNLARLCPHAGLQRNPTSEYAKLLPLTIVRRREASCDLQVASVHERQLVRHVRSGAEETALAGNSTSQVQFHICANQPFLRSKDLLHPSTKQVRRDDTSA